MKKLISLLLAFMMLLGCAAFAETAEAVDAVETVEAAADYTGEWTLTGIAANGLTVDPAVMGASYSLVLNADGTGEMKDGESNDACTWVVTEDGLAVTDDSGVTQILVPVDETLEMEMQGMKMIFSRVTEAAFAYPGVWTVSGAEMGGMPVDVAMLGVGGTLTLNADGTYGLLMGAEAESGTWAETETGVAVTDADGEVENFTLADEKLALEKAGMKMIFSKTAEAAAPAEPAAEEIDYVGYWALTAGAAQGVTVSLAQLSQMGVTIPEMYLALYEDGTGDVYAAGVWTNATWIETEGGVAITSEATGKTLNFGVQNGALALEQQGVTLLMTPATAEDMPAASPEPLANLTVADFNGNWVFAYGEYLGKLYDPAGFGVNIKVQLTDGTGYAELAYANGTEVAYDLACSTQEYEGLGTVFYAMYIDPTTGAEYGMVFLLYDNGELVMVETDQQGNDIYYCFVPAEGLAE